MVVEWTDKKIETARAFNLAAGEGSIDELKRIFSQNSWLLSDQMWDGDLWLEEAINCGQKDTVGVLLDFGFNVNAQDTDGVTALRLCVMDDNLSLAEFLLRRGADPSLGRTIITALNRKDPELRRSFVDLLIDYGLDLNQVFLWRDDGRRQFTALDHVEKNDEVIRAHLRRHGAKTFEELGEMR